MLDHVKVVRVREWMSTPVQSVRPDTSLSEAHQIMTEHNIRRLPVVNRHGHLVGIVTIGDVREARPSDVTTLSIWELNYLWTQLKVEKVMSRNVLTIDADAPIIDAARIMLEHKVSGLPVTDLDGKMIGIVTESDIFRMLVKNSA